MFRCKTNRPQLMILARLTALVGAVAGVSGCEPSQTDGLLIATSWPLAVRGRLEREFERWVKSTGPAGAANPPRIAWLILASHDQQARLVERGRPPDILLGGTPRILDALTRRRQLDPIDIAGAPHWLPVIPADRAAARPPFGSRAGHAFDDPRDDPFTLARSLDSIDGEDFAEAYSRLVGVAATAPRIGRQAPGAVETPIGPSLDGSIAASDPIEGVAILRTSRHLESARIFLSFLIATGPIPPGATQPRMETDPAYEALVADLLGATLVDARDELWSAWTELDRVGYPAATLKWMTEAPPWPPASVAKILEQPGDRGMPLLNTLAKQLAPDPASSAWLLRSWLSPTRRIDKPLLIELARAEEGGLYREPRFRSWLRAEWTAWARQRYRRVRKAALSRVSVAR